MNSLKKVLLNIFTQFFAAAGVMTLVLSFSFGEFPPPFKKIKHEIAEFQKMTEQAVEMPANQDKYTKEMAAALAAADGNSAPMASFPLDLAGRAGAAQAAPSARPVEANPDWKGQIQALQGKIHLLEWQNQNFKARIEQLEARLQK